MSEEDQEHVEEYLALERYIEALQAGRVAHQPVELTPELARLYRMALALHSASQGAEDPRPEFVVELETRLTHEAARRRAAHAGHRPGSSSPARSRLSRRTLLRTGVAVAASLSVGAGVDHALEEQRLAALTAAHSPTPPWIPLVPDDIPTTEYFVTTLERLGEQPVPFRSGGIVGYLVRNDAPGGEAADGPVLALSAACTHMGCLVNWDNDERTFRCPCHGGVFSTLGTAATPPATIHYLAPLPRLATTIDPEGNIFVRVPAQTPSIHW